MNRTLAGIARVAAGNAIAQAITVLSSLVIARLVAPSEFGGYAAITATTSVIGVLASLRLELAIPIPAEQREAHQVLEMVFSATLLTTAISGVVAAAMYSTGALHDYLTVTPQLIFLILVSIALIGVFNGLNQMALRERQYRIVAIRVVAQGIVVASAQTALVTIQPSTTSLLTGQVTGQLFGVLLLLRAVALPRGAIRAPVRLMLKYRAFPLIAAPSAVVNTLGLQAPLIMGTALWGATFAGWFGMTQRLLALPVTIVGGAIGQVFMGEFSSRLRDRDAALAADLRRASLALTLASSAVAVAVLALAPSAFEWVLGEQYREAGTFAKALAVGLAAQLVAGPLSVLLPLLGKQLWQGAWDVSRLLATLGVLWAAEAVGLSAQHALWFLGSVNAILYFGLWLMIVRAVRNACAEFRSSVEPSDQASSHETAAEE